MFRKMKPQSSTPADAGAVTTTVGSSGVRHTTHKRTWLWWTIAPLLFSILSFNVFQMHQQHYDRHVVVSPSAAAAAVHDASSLISSVFIMYVHIIYVSTYYVCY
jgi:hypothetical protein